MTSANIIERRNRLVELVRKNGRISTEEASSLFGVSSETIRQDFLFLEERHILKKVHGGAVAYERAVIEPLRKRQAENGEIKRIIAQKAMEYITPGITIGMDMGSTVAAVADLLAPGAGDLVITNSLLVLQKMADSRHRVYCLGGEYNAHDMAYQGDQAVNALRKLHLDLCFLGTSGVQGRNGICSTDFHDICVKQEFMQRSRKTIVLADSSKFNTTSLVEVADWQEVDVLITDRGIDAGQAQLLREKLELVIADE
ncbi:DeoR/GlpR family DNA-binding transcription regulator [uncultured Ruthenibacterium sp.]|uniref:DeoR/GlpR family DNA-binding transcription regulator n=1 Tax=uncultured Ruthenibacterium sp. TaxID=1905347 RepID=UPI00349EBD70